MKYSLNASEAKKIDNYSIEEMNIPSIVLMERAALSVADFISSKYGTVKNKIRIIAVCGSGNNGADGVCAMRILHEWGYDVAICYVQDMSRSTNEMNIQKSIADKLQIKTVTFDELSAYDVIVDAIFGIGLNREITGNILEVIEKINSLKEDFPDKNIISVDIPSGVSANDGRIFKCAVKADYTITFGYMKNGILLNPGAMYAGEILVRDCGFAQKALNYVKPNTFYYELDDVKKLPKRKADSNKGTYGKVLIIAGSKNMCGAAYFAAKAAYRMGAGLVRILTSSDNREPLKKLIPEAVLTFYDEMSDEDIKEQINWSNCIVMGPGLSTESDSTKLVLSVIDVVKDTDKKIVLDADALNILAKENRVSAVKGSVITPHLGEMSRLTGLSIGEIKDNISEISKDFAAKHKCVCVLKDARTVVSDGEKTYINISGNSGMSTAGSGDVLTGIIVGTFANGMELFDGATLGCYIHGCAGDAASKELGEYAMMADDIANFVSKVI